MKRVFLVVNDTGMVKWTVNAKLAVEFAKIGDYTVVECIASQYSDGSVHCDVAGYDDNGNNFELEEIK